MPLRFRRGTDAERLTITPEQGEPIYVTDTKKLFVGDGATVGGIDLLALSLSDLAIDDDVNLSGYNLIGADSSVVYDSATGTLSANSILGNVTGSVLGDNSTVLVDATNNSINLDGTVKGDVIPDSDSAYDLGSPTNKFKDLYLSGNSLWVGSAQITSTGSTINLPAGSTIGGLTLGTGGEILPGNSLNVDIVGDDSSIIVDTATNEVYASKLVTDTITSQSGLSVKSLQIGLPDEPHQLSIQTDFRPIEIFSAQEGSGSFIESYNSRGTNSTPSSVVDQDKTFGIASLAYDGAAYDLVGGIEFSVDGAVTPGDVPGKMSVTFGNLDTSFDIVVTTSFDFKEDGVLVVPKHLQGDVLGSIFADDSTLLVDGVNSAIFGNTAKFGDINLADNVLTAKEIGPGTSRFIIGTDTDPHQLTIKTDFKPIEIISANTGSGTFIESYGSRGTNDSPTAVQNGDNVFGLASLAYDGSDYDVLGTIEFGVDGTVAAGNIPGKVSINFGTLSGFNIVKNTSFEFKEDGSFTVPGDISATNLTLSGDLTVLGTTTSVNTADTTVSDNIITLNDGESGAGITAGTAGIEIDRGSASNVSFVYNDSVDKWTLGSETLVTGGLEITGAFALPTADGTAGQVLSTDGLGNTSWTTVSGSGIVTSVDGDVTGSLFGDNSTLLVDGVNNKIVGDIDTQNDIELNGNNIEGINAINTTLGVHSISMNDSQPMTLGSSGGVNILGGAGANIQIGYSTSGTVTLGSGSNTVDFVSGTTVDFANTTVNNLPNQYPTRNTTSSSTSGSHADGTDEDLDLTGYKGYALLKIQTDDAAWVRIYTSNAARTADASRSESTDPTSDAGVIAEVITTGAETVLISPGAFGFNDETTPTTTIPVAVRNKSGVTKSITVTLTILQMEA